MDVQSSVARFDQAVSALSPRLKDILLGVPKSAKLMAFEVRVRVGKPMALTCPGKCWFVDEQAQLHNLPQHGYIVTQGDVADSVITLCGYSVHSHQQEMANGFITTRGGHRAGICGTAVTSGKEISAIRDISSINLRIAREVRDAATPLIEEIFSKKLCGVLIIGIPSSGKTTILRDLARQLACGKAGRFVKVAVVDERCEIGAVYDGVAQNDLGVCCDILSGYPKGQGILSAVRTLSPHVILCDEIGAKEEVDSMLDGINCGVRMVATAHAENLGELLRRPQIVRLLEHGAFDKIVRLGGADDPGKIVSIVEVGGDFGQDGRYGAHRSLLIDGGSLHGLQLIQKGKND